MRLGNEFHNKRISEVKNSALSSSNPPRVRNLPKAYKSFGQLWVTITS